MHAHYLQHDGWVHPNSLRTQCHVCHWCNLLCVPLQHRTQRRMEERLRQPWRQSGRHHWHAVTSLVSVLWLHLNDGAKPCIPEKETPGPCLGVSAKNSRDIL